MRWPKPLTASDWACVSASVPSAISSAWSETVSSMNVTSWWRRCALSSEANAGLKTVAVLCQAGVHAAEARARQRRVDSHQVARVVAEAGVVDVAEQDRADREPAQKAPELDHEPIHVRRNPRHQRIEEVVAAHGHQR